jgi:hypothetical protein
MNPTRRHAAFAAVLATLATFGSVSALFHSAGPEPADPVDRAASTAPCNTAGVPSRRQDCRPGAAAGGEATRVAER